MKPADRIGMLDRQSCQIAACALPGGNQNAFALNSDSMGDKHPAETERCLGGADHSLRQPAADEDSIGNRKTRGHDCGISGDNAKTGHAMGFGIGAGTGQLIITAVNGIGMPARRVAQEIDRNRTGAAANIPQHCPRKWCQFGQRAGTCIALRQLAIILETAIRRGKPRRDRPCIRTSNADDVKIRDAVMPPALGSAVNPRLINPAQVRQNMQYSLSELRE